MLNRNQKGSGINYPWICETICDRCLWSNRIQKYLSTKSQPNPNKNSMSFEDKISKFSFRLNQDDSQEYEMDLKDKDFNNVLIIECNLKKTNAYIDPQLVRNKSLCFCSGNVLQTLQTKVYNLAKVYEVYNSHAQQKPQTNIDQH